MPDEKICLNPAFHNFQTRPNLLGGLNEKNSAEEELAELIARIAADGVYEVVVLDLGCLARGMEPLLEICDLIYSPIKEDCVSSAKLEAWQEYLEQSGRSHIWERVRLLKLPRPNAVWQTETYLEQLLWGDMGDFIRNLLKGQNGGYRS